MFVTKLKTVGIVLALSCVAALATGLLCGTLSAQAPPAADNDLVTAEPQPRATTPAPGRAADLEQRVADLERQVRALTKEVEGLRGQKAWTTEPRKAGPNWSKGPTTAAADPKPIPAPGAGQTAKTPAAAEMPSANLRATTTARGPAPDAPVLHTYTLDHADAADVVRALDKVFEGKSLRASTIGNRGVLVYGSPDDLRLVEAVLKEIEVQAEKLRILQSEKSRRAP